MTRVDTSRELVIFPRAVRKRNIALVGVIGALGVAVLPMAWAEANWVMAASGLFMIALCGWIMWALARRLARGNVNPALKLSPQGLHLMTGTTGLIPWPEVNGLGSTHVGGNKSLVINVNKAAMAQLQEGPFFKAARKFDTALGVHALVLLQTQVEVPLHDLADMIHDYSIAHGGPALQPNRTP